MILIVKEKSEIELSEIAISILRSEDPSKYIAELLAELFHSSGDKLALDISKHMHQMYAKDLIIEIAEYLKYFQMKECLKEESE